MAIMFNNQSKKHLHLVFPCFTDNQRLLKVTYHVTLLNLFFQLNYGNISNFSTPSARVMQNRIPGHFVVSAHRPVNDPSYFNFSIFRNKKSKNTLKL